MFLSCKCIRWHYTVLRTSEAQIIYMFLYRLLTFCGVQSVGCLMSSFWEEQKLIVVHVRRKFFFRDPVDTYEETAEKRQNWVWYLQEQKQSNVQDNVWVGTDTQRYHPSFTPLLTEEQQSKIKFPHNMCGNQNVHLSMVVYIEHARDQLGFY